MEPAAGSCSPPPSLERVQGDTREWTAQIRPWRRGGGKRGCQQQRGENLLSQFRPVKKSKLGSFGDYLKRSTESSRGAWVLSRVQARTIPPEAWPSRPPCGLRRALRLRLSPGNPSWAKGIPKFINLDCIFFSSPPFSGLLGQ